MVSLRKQYGGVQVALVSAPAEVSKKIIKCQRLRLGMVSFRVRPVEDKIRCFRCTSYGHMTRDCKGPDRSKECRRCGSEGHFVKDCEASREEALEFGCVISNGADANTISNESGTSAEITNGDQSPQQSL